MVRVSEIEMLKIHLLLSEGFSICFAPDVSANLAIANSGIAHDKWYTDPVKRNDSTTNQLFWLLEA